MLYSVALLSFQNRPTPLTIDRRGWTDPGSIRRPASQTWWRVPAGSRPGETAPYGHGNTRTPRPTAGLTRRCWATTGTSKPSRQGTPDDQASPGQTL